MKIIIPMAGLGSRMKEAGYEDHKPLIQVNGKSLIRYSVESLNVPESRNPEFVIVLRNLGEDYVSDVRQELELTGQKFELVVIDEVTSGATATCLKAFEKDLIHAEDELCIINCDQYLDWDSVDFFSRANLQDAAILTYKSNDPKNSFARVNSKQEVIEVVEKEAISDQALVGVHYWTRAVDFFNSANWLLENQKDGRETYISETLNHLEEMGLDIVAIEIKGKYWSTGTPEDLAKFKGYIAEYKTKKPRTLFIDLDGTVFMHSHKYSSLQNNPRLCPGVREALDELDSNGDTIILCSARKESARAFTEEILLYMGIPYDHLLLGISQGKRIVINDIPTNKSVNRAGALNVICDQGWKASDIK